jgi:hypothetical protein
MTLTREQVLEMGAGIEIDKLVAIHVMGWETRKYYGSGDGYHEHYIRDGGKYENVHYPDRWQPSNYIDSAWEVVEKMGHFTQLTSDMYHGKLKWHCSFSVVDSVDAETAPLAICRAALLSIIA